MARHRANMIDETGNRHGRLSVTARADSTKRGAQWSCVCDCGNRVDVSGSQLRNGKTRSCGCLARDLNTKHGESSRRTPEYSTWHAMLKRCTNPNATGYDNYGGRGIAVCDRWRRYENFLADMGRRPLGTSIDRRDNDGNYEPGNCRWATAIEQSRNMRSTKLNAVKVVEIRALVASGMKLKEVGKRFGVAESHVSRIANRKIWGDVA